MSDKQSSTHYQKFDESYFKTDTYEKVSFEKYSQYWWSNRFYAILARRYGQRGSRLLEIGTGLGHLSAQLEDSFDTYAIDVNPWALQRARGNAVTTLLNLASAEELPYASGKFGVVIIKHVVEHLPHPEKAIRELGRVLAPGGTLILSAPNLGSLLKPLKGDRWIGYQDPTHISLLPPEDWLHLIRAEAGLRTLRISSDGFWDVPYLSHLPDGLQKLLFGSLGGFQAITGWLFLPLRWGESLIVIAHKSA